MSQEPTDVCCTVQIVDCLLVSFHPEELRLILLPSIPSGSLRARFVPWQTSMRAASLRQVWKDLIPCARGVST